MLDGQSHIAAVSIGSLPTFSERAFQIEAYLLDLDGDLYGRTIEVELIDWVREQRKYASVELLKKQIARDIERIRYTVKCHPELTHSG